jgi:hypothetical protein
MNSIPCPCCGFLTLKEEVYGSYSICQVCSWEDDGVQLANPTSAGGANAKSLGEAQAKAIELYPTNIKIASGYLRSTRWRPLKTAEILTADSLRAVEHWYSKAVLNEIEAYWLKK